MTVGQANNKAERGADVRLRSSTVLLLLATFGLLLRLAGGDAWLLQVAMPLGVVLARLAPIWAVCGSMAASVYLMLSMVRPYNVVQHLVEMAAGVALIVLMRPMF